MGYKTCECPTGTVDLGNGCEEPPRACPEGQYLDYFDEICLPCGDNCASCKDDWGRCEVCTNPSLQLNNYDCGCPYGSVTTVEGECADDCPDGVIATYMGDAQSWDGINVQKFGQYKDYDNQC